MLSSLLEFEVVILLVLHLADGLFQLFRGKGIDLCDVHLSQLLDGPAVIVGGCLIGIDYRPGLRIENELDRRVSVEKLF